MQIIDLFSGIGGFSLAGHWMGWETIQFCEIDKYCQKVLAKNFPDVPIHDNIKTLKGEQIKIKPNEPTILVGGFPCQPFSVAGKRKGNKDARHLFPEMLRIIREVRPKYVVGENVAGIVSWDGGLVFEEVQSDLEAEGYEVQSFILPAVSVGAPHRRDRVWFVAKNTNCKSNGGLQTERSKRKHRDFSATSEVENGSVTNSSSIGCRGRCKQCETDKYKKWKIYQEVKQYRYGIWSKTKGCGQSDKKPRSSIPNWEQFPTQSPICGRNDGVSNRMDRLKCLGNSIVPQVAFEIFKAIQAIEDNQ